MRTQPEVESRTPMITNAAVSDGSSYATPADPGVSPDSGRDCGGSLISATFKDIGIEPYDSLAARLLIAGEGRSFVLAVTSSASGEGVTTVCAGIALALATNTSKSVLLLDANLRRPSMHELLGVPMQPGLRELVAGTGIVAFPSEVPNLSVVPSGLSTQSPAQLLTSEAAKARIGALRDRFDYLLIDCPPVLTAAEASSLCRLADGVIIVLRSGLTPRDDVRRAKDLLDGAPIMGVILNGV